MTSGSNGGFSAGVGYDATTGRGTPIANQLIPDLAGGVTITGTVFQDADGSGTFQGGETPVSGATVYVDLNNNNVHDSNEPSATTGASGVYSFSDLVGRTYTIRQITPSGDAATSPASLTFTANYGQTYTENFGVYPSTASFSGSDLTLKLDSTGTAIQVYNTNDDVTPSASIPKSFVSTLSLNGTSGDDNLVIDMSNGNPLAGINVTYDGGAHAKSAGDSVSVVGTTGQDSATFSNSAITINGGTLNITNVQGENFDGHGGLDDVTDNASIPLTFTASQDLSSLTLGSSAIAQLAAGGNVISTNSLSLASTAKLDLADGGLIDNNSADAAAISASLASGYSSGLWSGVGIDSSAAAGDASKQTALGYVTAGDVGITTFMGKSVGESAILVKFTKYGDNNLDGKVDLGNDFALYQAGLAGYAKGWEGGDYNYDGKIDQADFNIFIDAGAAQI